MNSSTALHLVRAAAVALYVCTTSAAAAEEAKEKVATEVAVGVSQIARMSLNAHVAAYGTVEPAAASAEEAPAGGRLGTPFAGLVAATPAYEGQQVKKGAVLVRLDTRAADAAVDRARAAATLAQQILLRQKNLLKVDGSSDKLVQEAEQQDAAAQSELQAARALRSQLVITAPFAGVVMRINVRPGEIADPATPVVELAAPSRLVASAGVPDNETAGLKLGRPVIISTSAANSGVDGTLIFVSPEVDVKTGAVTVRASVPANAGLRPGQFVRLNIATVEHANVLAVPVESVVRDPELGDVVAFVEGNVATLKPVHAGVRDGDWVEIEGAAVKAGATVVSVGAYGLPKTTKIRIVTPDN
jgi:membrane fusion protein (multidrug efflux system)